jgi:hypothetical protein
LQTLESNTTLSLQYIESQSKFLQEALSKLERRQVAKVDLFLKTLNNTVLSELRELRTQYDQIWQGTVIALDTQREQSEREIVALSSRMERLADEVVFQKRMAIVQSIFLVGCLFLVIFSRGLGTAGMELYYPNQFLGSNSRLASPSYPWTPHNKSRQQRSPSLRESIEGGLDMAHHTEATPPRQGIENSLTPTPEQHRRTPQRHPSAPDANRSSPSSRSVLSDSGIGLDYYQPPTPASLDIGYDSEHVISPPIHDYFASQKSSSSTNGDVQYREMQARKAAELRQLTPLSESNGAGGDDSDGGDSTDEMDYILSGTRGGGEASSHRGAARPPMSHVGSSRKPLPALPEDPDGV